MKHTAIRLVVLVLSMAVLGWPGQAQGNLLENPSFEVQGPAHLPPPGWTPFSGAMGEQMWVEHGHAVDGEYALVIDTGGKLNTGLRSLPIPAEPGELYTATVKVYFPTGNRPQLYIDFLDGDQRRVRALAINASRPNTWEELTLTAEAPPGTKYVTIILYANASLNPHRFYMDQATLERDLSYTMSVEAERTGALYDLDEEFAFLVHVLQGGRPASDTTVTWRLVTDGGLLVGTGATPVEDGVARVTGKVSEPGFVRIHATVQDEDGPVTSVAAVGVGVDRIQPSRPAPEDFDEFWAAKKAELAQVPLRSQVTPVSSGVAGIEAFDVQVDSLGPPVSGYMARPAGAEPGSLPAIITLQGAGVGSSWLHSATDWAREGMLAMNINAHGIPNGQPASYYNSLASTTLANYWLRGNTSRDEFYFLGMFLRVVRAIDFITSQPEWDGKTLILYGTSQGGAQALAGAGLDDRVTFFVSGVTAMADFGGWLRNRPMGWPNISSQLARMAPTEAAAVLQTLAYFDVVYFAQRTKADGFFTVGFLDDTCAPTTVYTAYNAVRGEKDIYNDLYARHENTTVALQRMRVAVLDHVKKMREVTP